jgi:predicted ATP-grasp superfamily ATP-dependent carboligase
MLGDRRTPVIIMNMHHTGLGIARNLRHLHLPVVSISSQRDFPGNRTRYADFRLSPDSQNGKHELLSFLLDFRKEFRLNPIIFPTRDQDILFLDEFRTELDPHFIIPQVRGEALHRILNKHQLTAIAQSCGIPCPKSYLFETSADVQAAIAALSFPCIVKPLYSSQWRSPDIWKIVKSKVLRVDNAQALATLARQLDPFHISLLLQPFVPGPDTNLFVFCSYTDLDGQTRNYFTGRKVLQVPPFNGTGVIVEACPVPEIIEISKMLLAKLHFYGISEIEYKFNAESKEFVLIEINPRHWDQHTLGSSVGVNLTEAIYRDLTEHSYAEQHQIPIPKRWIAEKDLLSLVVDNLINRQYSFRSMMHACRGPRVLSTLNLKDPLPGAALFFQAISENANRFAAAALRKLRVVKNA